MSKKKKTERSKKQVDIGERPLKYLMDGGRLMVDGQLVRSKKEPEQRTVRLRRRTKRRGRKRQAYVPSVTERLNAEYKAQRAKKRREEKRSR